MEYDYQAAASEAKKNPDSLHPTQKQNLAAQAALDSAHYNPGPENLSREGERLKAVVDTIR